MNAIFMEESFADGHCRKEDCSKGLSDKIQFDTQRFVKEYWFENLNLRGAYRKTILDYVGEHYPDLAKEYEQIYIQKDNTYWRELAVEMDEYCKEAGVEYTNYFYHEKLVKIKHSTVTLQND